MAKSQLDFSGARNIIDPLEGLRASMQQAGTNLGQMIIQDENRVRQARQDARQDKQDLLATPGTPEWIAAQKAQQEIKIGGMGAEQAWKMENDPVYKNALAAAIRETPGTPEWTAAQDALQKLKINGMTAEMDFKKKNDPMYQAQINALNVAEKDRLGRETLANAIIGLPTETVTKTTVTPEQVDKARVSLESAAVTSAGDVYNKEFTRLTKPETRLDVDANGEVILVNTAPAISPEEAHQKAMEKAKLLDVVAGNAPVINESMLPKAGTTEAKKKLTADELTQAKLDATVRAVKEGKVPAAVALEVASKLTPVKTQEQKIAEGKLALDIKEFEAKDKGGMYKKSHDDKAKGDWIKSYDAMIKTYGSPDLIGKGDQADIEAKLSKIQSTGYSDKEMTAAIDAARGVYGGATFGVDEDGFLKAVQSNLLRLK